MTNVVLGTMTQVRYRLYDIGEARASLQDLDFMRGRPIKEHIREATNDVDDFS